MGYYINEKLPVLGKAEALVVVYNAASISKPDVFAEVPPDMALICVIEGGIFDAAAYCFNNSEFLAFSDKNDLRPKKWFLMDKELVHQLTGFNR